VYVVVVAALRWAAWAAWAEWKDAKVCSINIEYVWIYAPQNGWGRVESERRRKEGKERKTSWTSYELELPTPTAATAAAACQSERRTSRRSSPIRHTRHAPHRLMVS